MISEIIIFKVLEFKDYTHSASVTKFLCTKQAYIIQYRYIFAIWAKNNNNDNKKQNMHFMFIIDRW